MESYEIGNMAYRRGDFEQALSHYENGYNCTDSVLLEKLLLNSAQCNLVLRNYDVSSSNLCRCNAEA